MPALSTGVDAMTAQTIQTAAQQLGSNTRHEGKGPNHLNSLTAPIRDQL